MKEFHNYAEMFKTDIHAMEKILSEAMTGSATYSDVFFQKHTAHTISMEDSKVSKAFSCADTGAGVRVVADDRTGYSFSESLDHKSIISAARTARYIAGHGASGQSISLTSPPKALNTYYPSSTMWEDLPVPSKIDILNSLNDRIFSSDPRICRVRISLSHESSYKLVACSDSTVSFDFQPIYSLRVFCTAEQHGTVESNQYGLSGSYGGEHLENLNIDEIAAEAAERTILLFSARRPNPGQQPVVLDAGSSGILLHEAIGHGLEADFNRKGISVFSNRINTKIAEPAVTIIDDGTLPHARGSINVDDEGVSGQKTALVEHGILRSYMHDRISAKYYGVAPTGNGRRESFRNAPLPRMRTTYMQPGPDTREEIISSVKNGILAHSFTNGQVYIGAGDFTFFVKSGYLIENGKLTAPVKDVNLIGNGPDVLSKICMVGNDLSIDSGTWSCGKQGQSVPVSLGHPTIKVSSITVGSAL